MILDAALADLQGKGISETGAERVLTAVIDQGVFVPARDDGSLYLLLHAENGTPTLPACVSEACCAEHLPDAAGTVYCDAMRLMDIARQVGAEHLLLFASDGSSVAIPLPWLFDAMAQRGQQGNGQRLKLTWSTHPLAVALRDASSRRLREFPNIHCVWVSQARWLDTGSESLMVHMVVDDELPSSASQRFMQALLNEELTIGEEDPMISALALHQVTHAADIANLDRMGLDTVRIDHSTGRIEVISQTYDAPEAAEAGRRAHAEQRSEKPPRRWWQRS
ncbi:hypothetical protein OG625_15175 [Streptomyces sp. NBC_01351]|uniref:hypothetical protein n=1 Tax=Streptomyces sp. NBC_01351 TaxID=2903833 RepID=UPI002E368C37|nr:hypothetical protein [Streptomyces sp. NBC_01351]